ncbi:MAG: hypothetical protein AAGD00_02290 [Planctomycetota bacterium]
MHRSARTSFTIFSTALCAWGCSLTPTAATPDPPPDFSIAVTVLAPPSNDAPGVPISARPMRLLLEPDGSLRAGVGPGADLDTYPERVRTLTADQVSEAYKLALDEGLLDPANPDRREGNPRESTDRRGGITHVVEIRAHTDRWYVLLDGGDDRASTPMVERLAEWSYLRE